jgi:hypothetical protein
MFLFVFSILKQTSVQNKFKDVYLYHFLDMIKSLYKKC